MSDTCKCDHCGKDGRRRMFKACPEGWFYAEIYVGDEGPIYMLACSEGCRVTPWKQGPGNLHDPNPPRFPGAIAAVKGSGT